MSKMTIAEAINEKKNVENRIHELENNLREASSKYPDQTAFFDFNEVEDELRETLEYQDELTTQIRNANNNSYVDGVSLSELFLMRDRKIQLKNIYVAVLQTIKNIARGTLRLPDEPKQEILVDRTYLQTQIETLSEEISELNVKLQKANWQVEI